MQSINHHLVEVKAALAKKQKWELQLEDYKRERSQIEETIDQIERELMNEQKDVKRLERMGLSSMFLTFFGSKEERLTKERQEVVAVQVRLEEAEKTRDEIDAAIFLLEEKWQSVADAEIDYQYLLSEKEGLIKESGTEYANRLYELSEREGEETAFLQELGEAIEAGENVKETLGLAIGSLESASNWGVLDMFGGGMLSSLAKHNRIDEATEHIHEAQTSMREFQKELLDIGEMEDIQIDISGILKFADFFFDDIISDWMVQGKINDSLAQAQEQFEHVEKILSRLQGEAVHREEILQKTKEDRVKLVEGI